MTVPREVFENLEDVFGNGITTIGIASERIRRSSTDPEVLRMVDYIEDALDNMQNWRNIIQPCGGMA